MSARLYEGRRTPAGAVVTVKRQRALGWSQPEALPARLDVLSHSPDGFEWGYSGSGPAQLALAIVLDFLESTTDLSSDATPLHERAIAVHQQFKDRLIAPLQSAQWMLGSLAVSQTIRLIEDEQAERILDEIASTILEASDEEIIAIARQHGINAVKLAQRVGALLRKESA